MITPATTSQLNKIFNIYKSYVIDNNRIKNKNYIELTEKRGFFPGLDTISTYKKLLKTAISFLIYQSKNNILGFIIAHANKEYKDDKFKNWINLNLKQEYYQNPLSAEIYAIATDFQNLKKGVASKLLQTLLNDLRKKNFKYLFSVIITSPLTNNPSQTFHKKHGFRKIAEGKKRELFGFKNYASDLYCKVL